MNYKSTLLITLALASIVVSSCKKETIKKDKDPNKPIVANDSSKVNVYAAGYINENSNFIAAYWKNDTIKKLGVGEATGIALKGNDVYVVGNSLTTNGELVAAYWKNGIRTLLADSTSSCEATGIAVAGNDIYISGNVHPGTVTSVAVYWKNGVLIPLGSTTTGRASLVRSVAVQNNDVYFAGEIEGQGGATEATYWKNGNPVTLHAGKNESFSDLLALTVNGGNIYTAGRIFSLLRPGFSEYTATYWKNNTTTVFVDGDAFSVATAILIKGNDTYVIGNKVINAKVIGGYWKNGAFTKLVDGDGSSGANAVVTNGDDIYIGGESTTVADTNIGYPTYWKNGKLARISTISGSVLALSVVNQ